MQLWLAVHVTEQCACQKGCLGYVSAGSAPSSHCCVLAAVYASQLPSECHGFSGVTVRCV
jgi:hypothetical protein